MDSRSSGEAVAPSVITSPCPVMRADARRNHERLLDSTRAVLAEIGPGFAVSDVARHAGVAVSTLYRRFDGRQGLVRAVFERYVTDEVEPLVRLAVSDPDPWRRLARGLEATIETVVENTALLQAAREESIITSAAATGFLQPLSPALLSAQAAGVMRDDITEDDLPALVTMVVTTEAALPARGGAGPLGWRRYLTVLLDGLRADEQNHPLPSPP